MINSVFLLNQRGEVVIFRQYRDGVPRSKADAFRIKVIMRKEAANEPPVKIIDGITYFYTRCGNLFFVAASTFNVNACLVFQFLYQMIRIFKAYFGAKVDEGAIRNGFTLVYELLDEVLDHGYPQNCAVDVLKMYINFGAVKNKLADQAEGLTSQITGAIDWRRPGLSYKRNEVFIDVLESVNLLLSTNGTVLRNDVSGAVMCKTYLSGMPECKFGLNDKLTLDKERAAAQQAGRRSKKRGGGVEIDDCTFHRCVRLSKFEADRTITFIPPDGEFELMKYRIMENVNLPFRLIPVVEERGKTRVAYNIKMVANFSPQLFATNVVFTIPTPPNTARCTINVGTGRAKFEPEKRAIVWRVRRFPGGAEFLMFGEAELMASTRDKKWARPPITVEFQVPMFTASGMHVRFLKVFEKNNYRTTKWVRYITRAGQYQIRI